MSCRPLTILQLLPRARNRCVHQSSKFPSAPIFLRKPNVLSTLSQCRHLTNSLTKPSITSSPVAAFEDIVDHGEDHDLSIQIAERGADEEAVDTDGTEVPFARRGRRPRLSVKPWDVITAVEKSENALQEALDQKDVRFSDMYSYSVRGHEFYMARQYWSNSMRLLWNEDAVRLAGPLLSKHKITAAEFELRMLPNESATQVHPQPSHLLHLLSIVFGGLAHSARLTLSILDLLGMVTEVPFQVRADCLRHLRRFRPSELQAQPELLKRFEDQLSVVRRPSQWPSIMSPTHMDLLLHNKSRTEALTMIHDLLEHPGSLHRLGRNFLLDASVRAQDVESALRSLATFPQQQLEHPHPQLMHRIINLLHLETIDRSSGSGSGYFTVLPQLLKLGIRPDVMMHNMAIQNAVKFDVTPLVWDLVDYAQGESLELNDRTNLYLLKHSFLKEDLQRLNEMMSKIHQSEVLWRNQYIIIYMMNIVREICFYQRKSSPRESLAHLLTIYDRAYSRGALIKLGVLDGTDALNATNAFPDPSPLVLAFTLWTYVFLQRRDRSILFLWKRWTDLIEQEDPLFVGAARSDAPYNGFLLFLFRSRNTLVPAISVLKFMLERRLCKPGDETWSICIIAYLKYRESYHPMTATLKTILIEYKAKISANTWRKHVQTRYPDLDMESGEARQFVKMEQPHDAEEPWPNFSWNGAGMSRHYRQGGVLAQPIGHVTIPK